MAISGKDLSSRSSQDIYIMLLSKEERDKMVQENRLTPEQANLPYFTPAERKELFDSLSLPRLLLIAGSRSLGKAEYDLEQQTKDLAQLQKWIEQINSSITKAQAAKANKSETLSLPAEAQQALTEMLNWAEKKGITIDIERETRVRQSDGKTVSRGTIKSEPDLAIGQLQNISGTVSSEMKNIQTKVAKTQADSNTFTEMMSNVIKKLATELGITIVRSIS